MAAIEAWTDEQCQQAEEWAGAAYTNASDNDDVVVPTIPPHVSQWDTEDARKGRWQEDQAFWSRNRN